MKMVYLRPSIEILSIKVDVITESLVNDGGELGCTYKSIFGGEWE